MPEPAEPRHGEHSAYQRIKSGSCVSICRRNIANLSNKALRNRMDRKIYHLLEVAEGEVENKGIS